MVKHLSGATSSPSVANFCLRKTADSHGVELDVEAVEWTSTNEKAIIVLVAQLWEVLARGGFRLTKC